MVLSSQKLRELVVDTTEMYVRRCPWIVRAVSIQLPLRWALTIDCQ